LRKTPDCLFQALGDALELMDAQRRGRNTQNDSAGAGGVEIVGKN
jgi:hypothetical protein